MREIASAAGVPIASLYQYFPDKPALLRAIAAEFYARMRSRVAAALVHLERWQDGTAFAHAMIDGMLLELGAPESHLNLWNATQAVQVLRELDAKDAIELADLVRQRFTEIGEGWDTEELRDFCAFVVTSAGPIVRQSFVAPKPEGERIIREFKELIRMRVEALGKSFEENRASTQQKPPRRRPSRVR
jgi:AcrR family transcriptional regulator